MSTWDAVPPVWNATVPFSQSVVFSGRSIPGDLQTGLPFFHRLAVLARWTTWDPAVTPAETCWSSCWADYRQSGSWRWHRSCAEGEHKLQFNQTGKPSSCRVHRAKSHHSLNPAVFQHSKMKAAVLQQLNRALKEPSPLKCSFPYTTPNFSRCESGSASEIHFAHKHLLLITSGVTLCRHK